MNNKFREKLILVVLWGFMLYSTGITSVFASFWRTFDWWQYVWYNTVSESEFTYWYGYGNQGYWYWYGYGYWYGSYDAGYMKGNGVISLPLNQDSSVNEPVTGWKTVGYIANDLLKIAPSVVKKIQLSSSLISLIEQPVTVNGKTIRLDLPDGVIMYSINWNVSEFIQTGANVLNSSVGGTVKAWVELWDPNVVLIFNKPVIATIQNVWTDVSRVYYKLSGKDNFVPIKLSSSNCTPEIGKECSYLSGNDLVIKTYHFTTFVAVSNSSSSNSSSSHHSGWGGWWGGGGWYSSTTTTNNSSTTKHNWLYTVTWVKKLVAKVSFTTPKFKKVVPVLNALVEEKLETINLLWDARLVNNFGVSYYNFLKALKNYEVKKITKKELREKAKPFLNAYHQYELIFKRVVTVKKEVIKWTRINNYKVGYKNKNVTKAVNLLDKLIVKELNKSKYTKADVKNFYKSYNKFKLAVRYLKEVNRTKGRNLGKQYVRGMLQILKK